MLDVEEARVEVRSPIPNTGTLRGDLLAFAARRPGKSPDLAGWPSCRRCSARAETGPQHSAPLRKRAAQMQAMLDRASDRGETALAQTDVLDCILAPIYFRAIFGVGGLTKARLAAFVDRALAQPPKRR